MTLRHFQIFTVVVDNKTMHQAAERLFISQPGISQAIRELENHYQVILFERYKKRLILTREGEKLLKHCRLLLDGKLDVEGLDGNRMITELVIKHGNDG